MPAPLVIVGDALLDKDVDGRAERLSPDAPVPVIEGASERLRPGGAALAALLAARHGARVVLIAPFGTDPASEAARKLLPDAVTVVPLPLDGTLAEKTRMRAGGHTLLRVDRGGGTAGDAPAEPLAAIMTAAALLVCDYGQGATSGTAIRHALALRGRQVPLVWDPHPRGSGPVAGTRLVTPNHAEAAAAAGLSVNSRPGGPVLAATVAAERVLDMWPARAVAVTLGSRGALLAQRKQPPLVVPASSLPVPDPCGAGDQFAASAALALRDGALLPEAVTAGVAAATRYLAGGGVNTLLVEPRGQAGHEERPARGRGAAQTAGERTRTGGGTVVAAGGCFDVLHAGHVSMLRAARALGDCLVVCMNSDASVRRLKGPGRPLNSAADRAAVLAALGCVDDVVIFEEDTPEQVLARLRPHIWVKGGDYDGRELPEEATLRAWDGRVVTVPYLTGRSTTRLASAAARSRERAAQGR